MRPPCPTCLPAAAALGDRIVSTVSKETVRRTLGGLNVPLRWEMAEVVFLALCGMAGHDPESPDRDECGQARWGDTAGGVPTAFGRKP
jgi:hypothetical protein